MKSILRKTPGIKFMLLLTAFIAISVSAKAQKIRLTVKENLANCTGVGPQTCMQVKYKNSKNWEYFYGNIIGFNYKEGYRYVIDVTRTKRKNVPADASAYIYKLKKVIKKEKIEIKNTVLPAKDQQWNYVTNFKWKLIQLNGKTISGKQPYLVFDKDKLAFNGFAGCNRIFGSFEKTKNEISFGHIASTMMACEQMELESQFTSALNDKKFTFDVADQTLNLYHNNKLVLMFGKAPLDEKDNK